jgi:hypothetical protein
MLGCRVYEVHGEREKESEGEEESTVHGFT